MGWGSPSCDHQSHWFCDRERRGVLTRGVEDNDQEREGELRSTGGQIPKYLSKRVGRDIEVGGFKEGRVIMQEYGLGRLMVDSQSTGNVACQGAVFLDHKPVNSHIFASCESSQFLGSSFTDRTLQSMFEKKDRRVRRFGFGV
jgi:hypothetical protein